VFDPVALEKLRRLRAIGGPDLLLSVDGGVKTDNIGRCVAAGADILVAGTALFSQDDYRQTLAQWRDLAKSHRNMVWTN
jgi:ribulose-phosphate 3-epimerase